MAHPGGEQESDGAADEERREEQEPPAPPERRQDGERQARGPAPGAPGSGVRGRLDLEAVLSRGEVGVLDVPPIGLDEAAVEPAQAIAVALPVRRRDVDPDEGEGEVVLLAFEGAAGAGRREREVAAEELETGEMDPRRLLARRLAGRIVDHRSGDRPEPQAPG